MEDIILVGFGGHAESMADTIEQAGDYRIAGYTDQEPEETGQRYPWLGTDDCLPRYYMQGIRHACICVGYLGKGDIRDRLYAGLKKMGFCLPTIVDKSAVIGKDVKIGEGTFIGKNAVVNAGSRIGKMCIVNSGAVLEHGNRIGDFSHIAVHAVLCGNVCVSDHSFIGANATVLQGIKIGRKAIIGAGTLIRKQVEDDSMVYSKQVQEKILQGGRKGSALNYQNRYFWIIVFTGTAHKGVQL